MMNLHMEDDLPKDSLYGLVLDKILVGIFKPKFGDEKDLAVFSFFVKQRDAAYKLKSYIVQKNFNLLDVEVSPNPKSDPKEGGKYILFIEMNRNKDMFVTMDKLLLHIDHLVSIKKWYFKASDDKGYINWERDNFIKGVPQTPEEYTNKEPRSNGHDEIDHVPQNAKNADINHGLLVEVHEGNGAKFNQSYIQLLKEQIKSINENKLQMSQYIEDLKIDRQHLYKQLELSHDREKMALIREQQDFKRIISLENQVLLLAAPDSREMKIVTPEQNAYETDAKPVIGVVTTKGEVNDGDKIDPKFQDEYKKTPARDPHPDERPVLNGSSGLGVVFDLHDEISFGKSSGFIQDKRPDYPANDESLEKPAKQPDHETFKQAEKEKPEKDKIDQTDNENGNRAEESFGSTGDGGVHEPEDPVELQDLKHFNSVDSAGAARLDDIISQNFQKESNAKGEDESDLIDDPVLNYMALALEALKKEDYDKAIECFLKVVDMLPTAGSIVLNLADLYFVKKEYELARKYALSALELGEEPATLVLEKIKRVRETNADLPSSKKTAKEIAEAVIARVEGYKEGAEELEETIFIELAALNEAVDSTDNTKVTAVENTGFKEDDEKSDPKREGARKYLTLGVKAAEQKDYHKAIEHFTKAVGMLPDSAAGFCNLAVLNYRIKEYATAYRHAEKAIDLGSHSAIRIMEKIKPVMVADLKSSEGFEPAGKIEKGKSSKVAKKDEEDTFFIESGTVNLDEFLKTEKQNESDLAVDSSLRKKDAVVNDSFRLGLAAFEKREFRTAVEHFNNVVELLPNGIPSYIHLTKIHYYLGEYPQARKYAKKVLELGDHSLKSILEKIDAKLAEESSPFPSTVSMEPNEQKTPAEVIEGTEEEPEVTKSPADAKPDKKAVEDEPEPEIIVEIPDVEVVKPVTLPEATVSDENNPPGSIEKTVPKEDREKIDPKENAREHMALGVEAAGQVDYHKAVEHFDKVIEILPDSAVGFFNLAIAHYHLEDFKTACKNAEKAINLGLHSAQSILEKSKSKMGTVSQGSTAKNKEKPPAEETPIETDEDKPDHRVGIHLALPYEGPKEAGIQGKSGLKQAQDLAEPPGDIQTAAGEEFSSETLPPASSSLSESPQREDGSTSEHFQLGLAASERNDFKTALEYFNKVAMALPNVPSSFLNMADLHFRMKNYKAARKHAERALELGAHSAHRILSKIEDSHEVKSP
jgi:tetratricopeptide (TPR) repeat protein